MEQANIELTIVMPSYNRGEYIEEAIKSVLMQKVNFRYRLIIADDGSTDNSLEIVEKYRLNNPDIIQVLPSECNHGLLPNCIRVYENMKTKYFCIVDADDYWVDDCFLQTAYDFLEQNPEYTIYGSNTKILKNGIFEDTLFHSNCENEMTVMSVDDFYNGKRRYGTNTLETVFRNVIFADGVPQILRDAVGTLSEASFRGDSGRYIMHLKYGYAKFVNKVVCVYRQNEMGIWNSATDFHKEILSARAQIDYIRFYDGFNKINFYKDSFAHLTKAVASLLKMLMSHEINRIEIEDVENLKGIVEELKCIQDVEYDYDDRLVEIIKNEEQRDIIVWGTGTAAQRLVEKYLTMKDVLYYVDSNEKKQGSLINNITVLSPGQLRDINKKKYVIVASSYYNEIIENILRQKLCSEDEIINLYKMDKKYSILFK